MKHHSGTQLIHQLEKRKGGYYHLKIDAEIVNQFTHQKATRLICNLDDKVSYRCGLNHYGDGNFHVIIAGKYFKQLGKELDQEVDFVLTEDPDQLGVDIPEVLAVLMEQDADLKSIFHKITDGKKRSLIYSIDKIKLITEFLNKESFKLNSSKS